MWVLISLCVALGLLVPFWGFVALAIVLSLLRGYTALALALAVGADILYGAPGWFVTIPFTVAVLIALGVRIFLLPRMREETPNFL